MSEGKKIFLSYAHEQHAIASEISVSLSMLGHDVFFDESTLKEGEGYHTKIRKAVRGCDLFVFLISPDSQKRGKYVLTELGFAKEKWRNPSGKILPVMAEPTPYSEIDPYLKAVTVLEPHGNLAAEVSARVSSILDGDSSEPEDPPYELKPLVGGLDTAKLNPAELVKLTTKEWFLSLLNQPTKPPFKHDAKFKDEMSRVYRLVTAVVFVSAFIYGAARLLSGDLESVQESLKSVLAVLIIALLVTLLLKPILIICGVRVRFDGPEGSDTREPKVLDVGQIFFTVVLTFVPWIPIFAFIRTVPVPEEPILIYPLLLAPFLCFVYVLVNFAKSLKILTNEKWYRICAAMIIPFLLTQIYRVF